RCFSRTDSIMLVTAGSPVVRWFFRFFPAVFFPPSVAAVSDLVRERVATFRWINVYRPFDYVGANLGLSRHGVGRDICTGQYGRWLSSHTNYWSDEAVTRLVRSVLAEKSPPAPAEAKDRYYVSEVSIPDNYRAELSGFTRFISGALIAIVGI